MGVRNIAVTITGDGSNLTRALIRGSAEIDRFANKAETSNRRLALSWRNAGLAAAALGTAAAVGLAASAVAAAQFESRMRNVNSLLHVSEAQFNKLSDATLALSTKLPQSANTLAEGLYDISSSGFAGADALLVLEKSAEAASAGMTTTANSAKAIAAVLNAYGLSAASAGDVSDTLFQTVNLGVISFDQLTGVIGDTVGTAAAAKVPIDDVGAAIATMTLNGLSASESGVSLNRVLGSLIKPSEALAATYKQLGYTSGAAALQSKGLETVLEDIRKASGGNITTLLQLFPEIRAARGALALMSSEGKNYQRVSKGIADENARHGATQKALREQMKSTSAQLRLFQNQATATAIKVGQQVLPVFVSFLDSMRTLGQEAAPLVQAGISAVVPLFESLYRTGANVVAILGELFHAVEPIGSALLAVGGAAIIGGLLAVARVLESVTGFLAQHKAVVQAVAALYAATLLPSVAAVVVAFNRFILAPVILGLNAMIGAAAGGSGALRALTASMLSFQTVATLGVAVALYTLFSGFSNLHKAEAEAKTDIEGLTAGFNALKTDNAQATIDELNQKVEESNVLGAEFKGVWGQIKLGLNQLPGGNHEIAKIGYEGKSAYESLQNLNDQIINTDASLVSLSNTSGVSVEAIRKIALAQNIDLSKPFSSSDASDARKRVLEFLRDMEKQSGTTGQALQTAAGIDLDALQALSDALADVRKKTLQAFNQDTDVLGSFNPQAAADAQAQATDRVTQAEQALHDARSRASADGKRSVSETISIRKAEEDLQQARKDGSQTVAEQPATLAEAYRRSLSLAKHFSSDIQAAQAKGLDPNVVTRLLELGPKQAEPILQQIVADHSGRLIRMVNESEAALQQIGTRIVEQARLTALATNSQTDTLSRNLTSALRVSAEAQSEGAKATVQSVAKALNTNDARVRQLAQLFGITLRDNIQAGLNSKPLVPPTVTIPGYSAQQDPRVPHRYATGGPIYGPGSGTSDSILARVSHGEYVHRAAAVRYYGVGFMERLNRMQLPRFASGGYVSGGSSRGGGLSAGEVAAIATALAGMAPRMTTHENHWQVYDYDSAMRQAEDAEALARLGGG